MNLDNFKKMISKAFNWLASSADNHSSGASGRKLTAIVIVALIIHGHSNYVDKDNYYNVYVVDVIFVCVLLGIVTIEQIIKFLAAKTGTTIKEEKSIVTETSTKEEVK